MNGCLCGTGSPLDSNLHTFLMIFAAQHLSTHQQNKTPSSHTYSTIMTELEKYNYKMITFKKTVLAQKGIIIVQVTNIRTLYKHFLDRKSELKGKSIMAVWISY